MHFTVRSQTPSTMQRECTEYHIIPTVLAFDIMPFLYFILASKVLHQQRKKRARERERESRRVSKLTTTAKSPDNNETKRRVLESQWAAKPKLRRRRK